MNWYSRKLRSTRMIIVPWWQIGAWKVHDARVMLFKQGRGDRRKEKSIVSFKPVRQFCIWNGWLIAHFHNFHLHLYPLIIPAPKFQPRNEIILFCWHVNARLATVGWHKIHVELPTETFTVNIQRKRKKERKKRGKKKEGDARDNMTRGENINSKQFLFKSQAVPFSLFSFVSFVSVNAFLLPVFKRFPFLPFPVPASLLTDYTCFL